MGLYCHAGVGGNFMKKVFFPLLTALILSLIALVRTDGFSIGKIHGKLLEGEANSTSDEIQIKLDQQYRYLAKGRQCFVFASDDGKYVIKFLNYNRFYFPDAPILPDSWCEYGKRRRNRFQKTVESFKLAFEHLSQETGIEYLHLQHGSHLPTIELVGPAGALCKVDLNSVAFVFQKRADASIFEKLSHLAKEGGEEKLQEALAKILSLLCRRCSLGIADDDRDIEINFGFMGDTPLLIDPGRLFLEEDLKTKEGMRLEMAAATKKLHRWLSLNYPSSAAWLKSRMTSESGVSENEL